MAEEIKVKTAKILTSQKIPDRTLVSKVYEPEKEEEKKEGTLYFLIEILSPWFPASEVAQTIIDTVTDEYYNSDLKDTTQRFEETLKKTNQKLAQLATKEKSDWVGKLNAICAITKDNSLHLSQSGNAQAYLFREKGISHITEGMETTTPPHPLITFGTITSGDLEIGDKIFITNKEIFQHLPIEEMRNLITSYHHKEALRKISDLLKKDQVKGINSFILEVFPKEHIEDEKLAALPEEIFLDQEEPGWLEKTLKTKPIPIGKKAESKYEKKPMGFRKQIKNFFVIIGKFTIITGRSLKNAFGSMRKSRREIAKERINRREGYMPEEFEPKPSRPRKFFLISFFQIIFQLIKNILEFLANLVRPEYRRFLFFILAILIIGGLIFGISILRKNQQTKLLESRARENLVLAENKEKDC